MVLSKLMDVQAASDLQSMAQSLESLELTFVDTAQREARLKKENEGRRGELEAVRAQVQELRLRRRQLRPRTPVTAPLHAPASSIIREEKPCEAVRFEVVEIVRAAPATVVV